MSVQQWRITGRRRFDPMSISEVGHFRLKPSGTGDSASLIDDPNISLYCLDEKNRKAVFVETDPDVDLRKYPFYYQGQFQHARQLLTIDYEEFHRLAENLATRIQCAVMIHSVGRCGSTFLSQLFDRLHECVSLSEPDVQTQICAASYDDAEKTQLLRSSTAFYFNPSANQPATHLVMKFRSFCVEMADLMYESFQPQVPLFLYRDIESVVTSGMRVFRYFGAPLWAVDVGHKLWFTRPILSWLFKLNMPIGRQFFPFIDRFSPNELARMGPVAILTIAWVSSMQTYKRFFENGLPFFAVRYDDLVQQPKQTMEQILDRCQLPIEKSGELLDALDRDSQEGSVVSRSGRKKWELRSKDRDVIREVLSRHDEICEIDYELPGTLACT
ncbi:MAG: hypothetical protein ACI9G1_002944 [Pirellulaceae bacterium]|jgi:hypothetical protein